MSVFPRAEARSYLKRHWVPLLAGLGLVLCTFILVVVDNPFATRLEAIAYDLRLNASLPERVDDRIVIVDIDDKSLAREGRWQWPRDRLAKLVDHLFKHGAALVAFDVIFAETDESSGLKVLEDLAQGPLAGDARFGRLLEQLSPQLDRDAAFAASLRGRPVVLSYFFNNKSSEADSSGLLPAPAPLLTDLSKKGLNIPEAYAYGANIARLQQAARGAGFVTVDLDRDGSLRRVPMLYRYQDKFYPALALEVARLYLKADFIQVDVHKLWRDSDGIDRLIVAGHEIPTDKDGQALVPFLGPWKSFPYLSATHVVRDEITDADVRGKIVIVGSTATGLYDLRSTPVASPYPGVEIHANLISGILDKKIGAPSAQTRRFYQLPTWGLGADVSLLLAVGLILAGLLPTLALVPASLLTLAAAVLFTGFNLLLWHYEAVLALAMPLFMIVLLWVMNIAYGYFFESRGRRRLMGIFGQYVPPALVNEMSQREENFGLEGDSREMTVLFADIRDFTALSEELSPTEVKQLLNRFFTPMTRLIHARRGTIDKYVGDMIMAFWGAPLHDDQHARHALEAAMAMLEQEAVLQQEFKAAGLPAITIGIGLNTGIMNVGNMGSEFRIAYTVLGDAVNLASRLEGLTRVYGARLIVSDKTRTAHDDLVYRELDWVRVKGKNKPVAIFEPLAYRERASAELLKELNLYHQALKLYRDANWDLAELRFLSLQEKYGQQPLYTLFIERIQRFRRQPPAADWQAVFDYTSK